MIEDDKRFNKELVYWNKIEELCINEDCVTVAMQILSTVIRYFCDNS